ncbi:hypothetical protein LEP1GSC125_3358 [Leptospira mayottensis 200901122]|uniref:Uncharacterized protein n=1 Tax=Leptospira mayottensis 200901122 TaxID=1193010 RepID=A0AA87SW43_9LEPT|nr:hypothetical protein LEP1GSC125_3358 [Leptospira mayottensis 200901122]
MIEEFLFLETIKEKIQSSPHLIPQENAIIQTSSGSIDIRTKNGKAIHVDLY